MKTLLVLLLLLSSASAYCQQNAGIRCSNAGDARAILQIAQAWKDGYNSGDSAKVAALYAQDAVYLTQHFAAGIVPGRAKIRKYVELGVKARYHIDSIQVLSGACSGDFAYAITRYDSTNAGQKAFGFNLVVLNKTGGKWLIVAHESTVPDPATAIQSLDMPGPR